MSLNCRGAFLMEIVVATKKRQYFRVTYNSRQNSTNQNDRTRKLSCFITERLLIFDQQKDNATIFSLFYKGECLGLKAEYLGLKAECLYKASNSRPWFNGDDKSQMLLRFENSALRVMEYSQHITLEWWQLWILFSSRSLSNLLIKINVSIKHLAVESKVCNTGIFFVMQQMFINSFVNMFASRLSLKRNKTCFVTLPSSVSDISLKNGWEKSNKV